MGILSKFQNFIGRLNELEGTLSANKDKLLEIHERNIFLEREIETRTKESELKFGENFYLPLSFGRKSIFEYEFVPSEYSKEEMETLLNNHYQLYSSYI